MARRWALWFAAIAACRSHAPAPTTKPDPQPTASAPASSAPAPSGAVSGEITAAQVFGEIIVVQGGRPMAGVDTGTLGAASRAMFERANAAALRVDTVIATPSALYVTMGTPLAIRVNLAVVARDSSGRAVSGFVPRYSVADPSVAQLQGGRLVGLRSGRTVLQVEPMVFSDTLRLRRRVTNVKVEVREAAPAAAVARDSTVSASIRTVPLSQGGPADPFRRPRSDSLPRDLIEALLGSFGGGANIEVGRAAAILPPTMFRDGRVLGNGGMPFGTGTVARLPYPIQVALDSVQARLKTSGWAAPPPPTRQERGFVTPMVIDQRNTLCRRNDRLQLIAFPTTSDSSQVLVMHVSGSMGGCDVNPPPRPLFDDAPIPALYPPPGATSQGGGMSGGSDSWYTRARLTNVPPLPDVVRHYASQFEAAKWTKADEAVGDAVVSLSFTHTDGEGRRWYAVFTAAVPPGSRFTEVSLQLRRL